MSSHAEQEKKSIFKKWWFWVIVVVALLVIIGSQGGTTNNVTTNGSIGDAGNAVTESNTTIEPSQPDVPKEYLNALAKAKIYSDTMHMSKQGIYDQLTSEYGEQFPAEAAQYAIDNLNADYKKNALEKAKTYQDSMSMSKNAIYDQLISQYGEKFTEEEAQYAIDNLE